MDTSRETQLTDQQVPAKHCGKRPQNSTWRNDRSHGEQNESLFFWRSLKITKLTSVRTMKTAFGENRWFAHCGERSFNFLREKMDSGQHLVALLRRPIRSTALPDQCWLVFLRNVIKFEIEPGLTIMQQRYRERGTFRDSGVFEMTEFEIAHSKWLKKRVQIQGKSYSVRDSGESNEFDIAGFYNCYLHEISPKAKRFQTCHRR